MEFQVKKDSVLKWLRFVSDNANSEPSTQRKPYRPKPGPKDSNLHDIDEVADIMDILH